MLQPDVAKLATTWSYPTTVRLRCRQSRQDRARLRAGRDRPAARRDRPGTGRTAGDRAPCSTSCATGGREAGLFTDVRANPVAGNVEAGVRAFAAGGHDGVVALGGGSALDCGKVIAFMAGQDRPLWDFEDIGDWWTRARADGIAPVVAIPDHRRHRQRGRPGRGDHRRGHPHQEDHLPPGHDAADRDPRPRGHAGAAAEADRGHRHGCAGPLPRGLLRALLASDGRGHRGRGHAAGQDGTAPRLRPRCRPRGARA